MSPFFTYIKKNKRLNRSILLVYYLAVVFLHGQVGRLINSSFDAVSRATYNNIITIVIVVLISFLVYKLFYKVKGHPSAKALVYMSLYTMVAILFSFTILFVIHIEAIHFIQYAILAALLFPLVNRYSATMIWATLAGAFDELHQYLFLGDAKYYDFNDVLLDAIGAGIGLLILKILGVDQREGHSVWHKRGEWRALGLLGIALVVMCITGHFSINYHADDPAYFTLFKMVPDGFWHYPGGPYARFHILTPIPGLILIVLTNWVYSQLDKI